MNTIKHTFLYIKIKIILQLTECARDISCWCKYMFDVLLRVNSLPRSVNRLI